MILHRTELKYYLPIANYRSLRLALQPFVKPDENISPGKHTYPVHSVYYDTIGFKYYNERINGEPIRTKFRIRYYEEFPEDTSDESMVNTPIWLELKSKHFNAIKKIRYKIKYKELLACDGRLSALLSNDFASNPQDLAEAESLKAILYEYYLHDLKPVVKISYQREALKGLYERDTRITFDSEIRAFPSHEFTLMGKRWAPYTLSPFYCVVEIKLTDAIPTWLSRIIERFNLQQTVHSKYTYSIEKCGILRTALGEYYEG